MESAIRRGLKYQATPPIVQILQPRIEEGEGGLAANLIIGTRRKGKGPMETSRQREIGQA